MNNQISLFPKIKQMKNITILLLLTFSTLISISQDLDEVIELQGKMKFQDAKTAIDNYLQNPKKSADAEAYYYKGRIYNSLSRESATSKDESFSLKLIAFDAFKKNQALDKKDFYLLLENHTSFLDLYYGFYDIGAKQFNSKNYEMAELAFKKAIEVKDYILNKKYEYNETVLYPIDTALILNIAASAIQAKKEDEAVAYYKILTDANINGADNKEVYLYLLDYYTRKDNEEELKNILTKAKRLYPNDESWIDAEIKSVSKSGDKSKLFSKYEELIAEYPKSFLLPYNYSVEMYNSLYGKDAINAGDNQLSIKLSDIIKIAINNEEKSEITATMLMTNHLFNMAFDLLNRASQIKSTNPEELKRKSGLKATANKSLDDCILYAENVIAFYESIEQKTSLQKANYKIVLGYLSDIYTQKKLPVKATEYDKKNAAVDKM